MIKPELIVMILVAVAVVTWIAVSARNDWCFSHLMKNRIHYRNVLASMDLKLKDLYPEVHDPRFLLTGDQISINLPPGKMLSLVRKLKYGQMQVSELIPISDTPYSKLPN